MKQWERYGYIIYFALVLFSFIPYLSVNICYIDEVTLLAEAKRVFMGEHQHRDFFSFYGGLNYYLIALIWLITGSIDYHIIKLLTFILIFASGIFLTVTARYYTKNFWLSLLPSLIYSLYFGHTFPFTNHHWFGSFATVLFLYLLVRYLTDLRWRDLYFCGIAAALSLLFIMHEGIINSGIGAFTVLATWFFVPADQRDSLIKLAGSYLAGFATLMAPALIFYISIGSLKQYFYNTFIWPFTNYAQPGSVNDKSWAMDMDLWAITQAAHFKQAISFFSLSAILIILLLPVLAMLVAGTLLTIPKSFSQKRGTGSYLTMVVLVMYSLGIYATAFSQPTFLKLIWGSVPAFMLMVMLLDWFYQRLQTELPSQRAMAAMLAFIMISITIVPIYRAQKLFRGDISYLSSAVIMELNHPVINLINSESGPDDYYFGYKFASLFYYGINARSATPYTQLVEDYLSREQLRDLYQHIVRNRPKFITFRSEEDLLWLTNQAEGFPQFLSENYRLRGRYETWLIYQLK